jgi:hypothetical protein
VRNSSRLLFEEVSPDGSVLIVRDHFASALYDGIIFEIAQQARYEGLKVVIGNSIVRPFSSSHTRISEVFRPRAGAKRTLHSALSENAVFASWVDLGRRSNRDFALRLEPDEVICQINSIDSIADLDDLAENMGQSVMSALVTDVARALNCLPSNWRRLAARGVRSFVDSYNALSEFEARRINAICVPNGRHPHQAGFASKARSLGLQVYYYEHGGERLKTFHFAKWRPIDRISLQESAQSKISGNAELAQKGRDYLALREIDPVANPFASEFSSNSSLGPSTTTDMVFFTSSDDEFVGCGNEWPVPTWADQWGAINKLVSSIAPGATMLVRVHPNTLNKTWRELIWVETQALSSGAHVIPSYSGTSTYWLIRNAKIVLTWGSTVALEAAALGIRSAVLAPTFFDEVGAVEKWTLSDNGDLCKLGVCDQQRALSFLGYISTFGYDLTNLDLVDCFDRLERQHLRRTRALRVVSTPIEIVRRPRALRTLLKAVLGDQRGDRIFRAIVAYLVRLSRSRNQPFIETQLRR